MSLDAARDEKIKARDTIFRLLKFRLRSEQEIRTKLKTKKFSDETVNSTVQYFKQLQLIDDRQFAKSWIAARLARPLGINRIRFELKTKGIAEDLIKEQLNAIDDTYSELETVLELGKRRFAKYKNIEPMKAKRRTFEYLSRRGFKTETISKAIRQL
ncbi:MAG: hypothetical protein A2787_05905 [Omnitrophica WOR_2 bacterium RIFCSPHIGHO2_01_FULL_48_9]|nr:MAG: hypothetical protein A3D10_05900 [Omnitrophica WOR_2 bacterium RIFCSPHIGHO2_02_FULL_48_11]OGX33921.1 MAG: hypothetical protein A2787_05905 [Omnitrophica WOR_2 bacterium RIFCSPHIGHO2_01_FULL_48_9]